MSVYLYGIGPRTRNYIAENRSLIIDGILDGYRDKGEFYGIPIIALENISVENAKIIIVARPASARIIYARIKEFCTKKKVEIYDVNGNRMEPEENERWPEVDKIIIDIEKLYRAIDRYNVVSFDIFDTLLVRKCGSIEKLFEYVAIKCGISIRFIEERIRAEKELSQNMTPDLESIYRVIANNMSMSQEESRRVLLEEIEAEKKFLVIRKELAEAFHYAVAKGKQVVLISDMYLNHRVLGEILSAKGINGYKKLYVSCEYSTDKAGSLFDIALGEVLGDSMLHIGDDEYRDYECAKRRGIDVFPVRSLTETVGWDLTSPETIGYSMLGPALYSFVLWLDARLREDGIKRIFFLARDGFLIKQIFDMVELAMGSQGIKEPIQSEYQLISRSLVTAVTISGEDDIRRVMGIAFDGKIDEMLENRFYVAEDELLPCEDNENAEDYILRHAKKILKRSHHLKDNYFQYLEKTGITRPEKAGIFDFVSTGTCQMCLERILGKSLYGYYYETVDDVELCKGDLYKKGYVQDIGSRYSCDNYFGIETLIKETVPTLREIDDTGKKVYGKEYMDTIQKEIIETIQTEARRYAEDRLALIPDEKFTPEKAGIYALRMQQITTRYLAGGRGLQHYDAFVNRKVKE